MKRFLPTTLAMLIAWIFLVLASAHAQPAPISGIVNIYTPVTEVSNCSGTLSVASVDGFHVGDTVLIIQMKGATYDQSNTPAFGTIGSYQGAGNFEIGIIA